MEKIKKKIAALLAKTKEAGCTEQEALAAAKKARDLLDKYNLSIQDIAIAEDKPEYKREYVCPIRKRPNLIIRLANAVSLYTDTYALRTKDGFIFFYGKELDTYFAANLLTQLEAWILQGAQFIYGREELNSYFVGALAAINNKLIAAARKREKESLLPVVQTRENAKRKFLEENNVSTAKIKNLRAKNRAAFSFGYEHGNRAQIRKGIDK